MGQFGKSSSSKKGKPSYFMSILGVTIVLFIWGVFGLIWIYVKKYNQTAKEKVQVQVYLSNAATKADIDNLIAQIKTQPFTKEVTFTDKEQAKSIMINNKEEDIDFSLIDSINPLPNTISFTVKNEYVHPDTLKNIKAMLLQVPGFIDEIKVPEDVIKNMSNFFDSIKWWLIGIAILFSILVVLLIDNTIRLAMYSNRFLIKTMQMVGATRNFIALPMDKRAVINGCISAVISIFLLYGAVLLIENNIPDLQPLRDNGMLLWLFIAIIVMGVVITFFSTHRSVIKYLKMKLDDLY
jgi:cell division transport system permease protein